MLVVDDIADNREMYAEYLRYAGFDVETADGADEAVIKVEAFDPHVVVMDLALPEVDGWEATRRIRSNPSTAHVRVLALSGHVQQSYVQRAYDVGADVFCSKPCLPQELYFKLVDLLPPGVVPWPNPATGTRRRPF